MSGRRAMFRRCTSTLSTRNYDLLLIKEESSELDIMRDIGIGVTDCLMLRLLELCFACLTAELESRDTFLEIEEKRRYVHKHGYLASLR